MDDCRAKQLRAQQAAVAEAAGCPPEQVVEVAFHALWWMLNTPFREREEMGLGKTTLDFEQRLTQAFAEFHLRSARLSLGCPAFADQTSYLKLDVACTEVACESSREWGNRTAQEREAAAAQKTAATP